MMQMICRFDTMLFFSSKAEFAASTDARGEPDSHQHPNVDIGRFGVNTRTESDDSPNSFMAADVWELDVCDGRAGSRCGGSTRSVEIWRCELPEKQDEDGMHLPLWHTPV